MRVLFDKLLVISMLYFIISCNQQLPENVKVEDLHCEMLSNPEGIDVLNPRLSWKITGEQRDIEQTAYQILAASSEELLAADSADLWNTGEVISNQSIHIKYEGIPLKKFMKVYWKVKVYANNGQSPWSETATWSMGLLHYKDWKGRWIGADHAFPWDKEEFHSELSARYYRKEFESVKEVKRATVFVMGLGLYELYVNGQKVGDQVLAPSPTDYTKTVLYNTFDVTNNIQQGKNVIATVLGNGRYYNMRQNYKPYKIKNFGYPKMMLNLNIEYTDGATETIQTEDSWKYTADGPIRSNNEYDGEIYDARKEMKGWNLIGFNDSKWLNVEYVQEPGGEYKAQMNNNMKIMDTIVPVDIKKLKPGVFIMDMGQNMAGWVQLRVKGKKGDEVRLRFAEVLQDNGELYTEPLRSALATDIYILKGGEKESWEPHFVYHGFRYVEITGYPGVPALEDFKGMVVFDNMETLGSFETSNEIINQTYKNTWWTIASNYKGMPVDCPQRDERQPWLGDRAIGAYGESFIFNNSALYRKWLDDIKDSQKEDGSISDVAPPYYRYYSDNMTWPGTYILVTEMLYNQTGDVEIIRKHYQPMKKWLVYMKDQYMTEDLILKKDSYGDWCAPPKTIEEGRGKNADEKHPSVLISTAYYYHFMNVMMNFAHVLNNSEEYYAYKEEGGKIKNAFHQNFYQPQLGCYNDSSITDNILPLYFGLVPENYKSLIFDNIVKTIEVENNGHLSTGLVGIQWLMRTLTENGRADLAYKLATTTTYPSWGYMVKNGATTIWELWNGNTAGPQMSSRNHVMLLGDLIIWYYENLAGIKSDPQHPGFKKIIMHPSFIEGLDHVKASYMSVHGLIKSEWTKTEEGLSWNVTIPANTTARVYIPALSQHHVKEGGRDALTHPTIEYIGMEGEVCILDLKSGEYAFQTIKLE